MALTRSTHQPPAPDRIEVRLEAHGRRRADEYAWMRAENWQQVMRDPATLAEPIRAHLEAENAYADAVLADTAELQETLLAEMRGRIKEDDSSVPTPHGPYAYSVRHVQGGEYPLVCRSARDGGGDEVLLDGNAMAEGCDFFNLGAAEHSPDHRLLAYAVDLAGSEFYTIRIKDLVSGTTLADSIANASGGMVWAADSSTLFYTLLDDNHRSYAVMRHRVGTPSDDDVEVYRDDDPAYFVSVSSTLSGAHIVIRSNDHETVELHVVDALAPETAPRLVSARRSGHEYGLEHVGDRFVILTNNQGAEDFRIVTAPVDAPGEEHWEEIEPHRPGRLILDVTAFAGHLVRLERESGLPRIVIREGLTGAEHAIAFDEEAYGLGMSPGYEHQTTTLRFSYSSLTTPAQVFDYDMVTRARVLRKTQEVPSGHDPSHYIARRIMATAPDGESVPISLFHHRDTPIDGTAPVHLYGYGSYGISIPAAFNTNRLSLADRGIICAIAHVRGGKDKGYAWYRQGKREHKVNTFTDFVAAAEHLIAAGYTGKGRIVAEGGSAGGLLIGAVANRAPELFAGMVAFVPFVDVLNTILDASLPLTPPEWTEWGNPIESAEAYDLIASYSPYDNVAPRPYPPILAIAGLTDPRVTYWEPAKWIARLRAHSTSGQPMLMRMNMSAGHAGAPGRFERLREFALAYAFTIRVTGAHNPADKAEAAST
ncbi:MAG: prolyl oligopeptidase family serine peptidase [Rhizobiales bacterium]|nr:prolyl oligopeptidase family serine peptidase [Hyphomicrobiales bacterium]